MDNFNVMTRQRVLTVIVLVIMALGFSYERLDAQSSPLTIQPSTGRVGVGNTNPAYPLDVTGTVNATAFRGDGSQLTNLPGGLSNAVTVLDKVTTDVTVTNTGAQTTVYSFSVPADTLGTNNRLRLTIHGEDRCSTNPCEDTYTVRLKYGATTLLSNVISPTDTLGPFKAEFLLSSDGAANSQLGLVTFIGREISIKHGTAATDSTAAQTLEVTVDWSFGAVNNTVRMKHAVLELLK